MKTLSMIDGSAAAGPHGAHKLILLKVSHTERETGRPAL